MSTPVFRRILCPVDFADLSREALRYASRLARCGDAKVTALYANSFAAPAYFSKSQMADLERQFRASFQQAGHALAQFIAETLGSDSDQVESRVMEGLPVDVIRDVSAALEPDLIVMGTHGRSGVQRLMLGSVAEHVIREAAAPVLTVRSASHGDSAPSIERILCPVNNSQAARDALALAVKLGACLGATVTILHVKERTGTDSISDLCAWISPQDRVNCAIREDVREGEAATEILSAASGHDLIVIGATHKVFFDTTVVGATTASVVRHAKSPVITMARRAGSAAHP